MRTFRITLSHGSERVTFDGAGARSGSMFHVRRDAIEGLWSSPASKVSLTERETANGASPISDGETLYAARTVVIPFAIQSNYNHTDLIRARTLLGRLIGWHDVRMDIYDAGDETVLNGYIEAKYSDIPYDHADTGTITLVCPDPRRVSKRASTVTLNTSSRSLGGLSFGVPAYWPAWTGTANNSTSTLSMGGQVVATNLYPNPSFEGDVNADVLVVKGSSSIVDPGVITPYHGTKRISLGLGNDNRVGVNIPNAILDGPVHMRIMVLGWDVGTTVSVAPDDGTSFSPVTFTTSASTAQTWVPLDIDYTPKTGNSWIIFSSTTGSIALDAFGFYTQSDWRRMQDRGIDWFTGDSQSPQPNAGLAFPLDFGQTGNAGNTGMIVNNGSYVSMPVITAHGWLDGGLRIHWNTSDGNEGDLSYKGSIQSVPITINTDTHSAIMGGLDVSYQLGSRDWPRIPAGGSCSFALLASGGGWATVQSHATYM